LRTSEGNEFLATAIFFNHLEFDNFGLTLTDNRRLEISLRMGAKALVSDWKAIIRKADACPGTTAQYLEEIVVK